MKLWLKFGTYFVTRTVEKWLCVITSENFFSYWVRKGTQQETFFENDFLPEKI